MELFSPIYYKKFKCIADRCRHSCCIDWEITVDEKTLEKYRSDGREDILRHISVGDDGAEIALSSDGRCPFLDGCGLCGIISECGEGYVSEICREHPRFYHRIGNICEVGLGAVCEEAARLIFTEEDFSSVTRIGEHDGEVADETDFDIIPYRDRIFALLSANELPYREKIRTLSEKYRVSERLSESWDEPFSELEYLEEENADLFKVGLEECRPEVQTFALRFLSYLVFRHVSVATDEDNLGARVGFCLLLLSIFENATSRIPSPTLLDVADIARRISSEVEYSEDNTFALIFEFECSI